MGTRLSKSSDWLLNFTSPQYDGPAGDGRPWGDGTAVAARADPRVNANPWDTGCTVETFIGGQEAMDAIRVTLNDVIKTAAASGGAPYVNDRWVRGRVYIADWRFNCLRDLSPHTDRWTSMDTDEDDTAIGLVRRLMQAGVQVRVLLWYPAVVQAKFAGLGPHVEDHRYAADLVECENKRLMQNWGLPSDADPVGVVALDARVAEGRIAGSHHQKMIVIRTQNLDVAFAGGVDLAYTRRDAPLTYGDWQSGDSPSDVSINMPLAGPLWPRQSGVDYSSVASTQAIPTTKWTSDLPMTDEVTKGIVFGTRQSWHDQHLLLKGPIVSTLESQFSERWRDTSRVYDLSADYHLRAGQVIFSSPSAVVKGDPDTARPLPLVAPVAASGASTAQMWRTIPWRNARTGPPFQRGEYTALAGIAHAVQQATELIWIFDQYFWSRALGVLLHKQLRSMPGLRVIIILPPHADTQAGDAHRARAQALEHVMNHSGTSVAAQVAVYSLWDSSAKQVPPPPAPQPDPPIVTTSHGIYVHAKVQMYDGGLLVCGSANLNRRSFLCDSELAIAVADPAVVADHQSRLWSFLFPGDHLPTGHKWPALDLNETGNGAKFFDAFKNATGVTKVGDVGPSRLILDPWDSDIALLPSGARRSRASLGFVHEQAYDHILDPSSLDDACEVAQDAMTGAKQVAGLDQVTSRLENIYTTRPGKPTLWPFRKQQ